MKTKATKTQTPAERPPTTDCGIARQALMRSKLSFTRICAELDISAPNLFSVASAEMAFSIEQRVKAKVLAGMVEA